MAAQTIDMRGEICPYPLFETRKHLEALGSGEELEVYVDYPLALDNITRWAENNGHTVVEVVEEGDSEWRIVLRKS